MIWISLVDLDNLPGSPAEPVALAITDWAGDERVVVRVFAKRDSVLRRFAQDYVMRRCQDELVLKRVGGLKNEADVRIAFVMGLSLGATPAGASSVLLFSNDRLLQTVSNMGASDGRDISICSSQPLLASHHALKWILFPGAAPKVRPDRAIDLSMQPAIAPSSSDDLPGLLCIHAPTPQCVELPALLPFPAGKATVTVGASGCDLNLAAWSWHAKRGSELYSPHVVFNYGTCPRRGWTMAAVRGFRRGARRTMVDGTLLGSAHGQVALRTGTVVMLGGIEFHFRSSPLAERASIEDPALLVKEIEMALEAIARCLGVRSRVPEAPMPGGCKAGIDDGAFIKDYLPVLREHWNHPELHWLIEKVRSRKKLRLLMGRLVRLRNVAMHPTRGGLDQADRLKLAELHLLFVDGWSSFQGA